MDYTGYCRMAEKMAKRDHLQFNQETRKIHYESCDCSSLNYIMLMCWDASSPRDPAIRCFWPLEHHCKQVWSAQGWACIPLCWPWSLLLYPEEPCDSLCSILYEFLLLRLGQFCLNLKWLLLTATMWNVDSGSFPPLHCSDSSWYLLCLCSFALSATLYFDDLLDVIRKDDHL